MRIHDSILARALSAALLAACASASGRTPATTSVGPDHGTVVVVGGGSMGEDIVGRFIELAGGPDALIIDVPTAGGAPTYTQDAPGAVRLRASGAKNVYVLHTTDKKIADTDTFAAHLARAGGVWFEGGRHFRLVDSYAGTHTERGFHDVLARGGVVGGSSAGASILGSFLVRGAPSNDNSIMDYPGYETGFGFLRGVGIDQHVVARERLPDLSDSIMPKHPELLGISEDEGTAWVVRGGVGEIIGRNKAFVYGGHETDPGAPFLTLRPGDRYDLSARRVLHRASQESPVTQAFVDSLFAAFKSGKSATVLVAQAGKVFVNTSYGVPPQRRFMPTTTMPNYDLGELSLVLNGLAANPLAREGRIATTDGPSDNASFVALVKSRSTVPYQQLVSRVFGSTGMHKTTVDTASGKFASNVDELYRAELVQPNGVRLGWSVDQYRGLTRESRYGTSDGRAGAFVRFPDRRAAIIVLTNDPNTDARSLADRLTDRLLFAGGT